MPDELWAVPSRQFPDEWISDGWRTIRVWKARSAADEDFGHGAVVLVGISPAAHSRLVAEAVAAERERIALKFDALADAADGYIETLDPDGDIHASLRVVWSSIRSSWINSAKLAREVEVD